MRQIAVSIDVFSKIWALRQAGEDTENQILERVLNARPPEAPVPGKGLGFVDSRHDVEFPNGTVISRTYKGQTYEALVRDGCWYLNGDATPFHSLNSLSRAITPSPENAWVNWFYVDGQNTRRPISALRERIARRGLGFAKADLENRKEADMTWFKTVLEALRGLGGRAHLSKIYKAVSADRRRLGLSTPPALEAVVRKELESNSSDSDAYQGARDAFYMPEGKGAGVWAIRPTAQF